MTTTEGNGDKCPACLRVFDTRIAIQVRAHGMKYNESIAFDDEDDLGDIETMRWYIRKAIAIRNTLKYGDANAMDDTPNDDTLYRLFKEYRRPERPVARPYQPHESVMAAQRDVSRVLARYGLHTRGTSRIGG